MKTRIRSILVGLALAAAPALSALAQTTVQNAWIRGTVPQQTATGMFCRITSTAGGKLVSASSPVAGMVEIHEMKMVDNMMRMRPIAGIDLPAGKAVDLDPSGYHVMLMELKQQLKPGDMVPVTLVVEGKDGKRESLEVKAQVKPLATTGHDAMSHDAMKR
ncbi:MAG TPA: copper chaperone PCu(A)C [Burkholderiales bacterium]|nr:copper chaperone PCu(A)C [Burkholderiales bacterium]